MTDPTHLDPTLLPSLSELRRATLAAGGVVAVLVLTAILPAELGVDPTGIGRLFGLTAMGELKRAEPEAHAKPAPVAKPEAPAEPPYAFRNDAFTLTLAPNEGTEIKAVMRKGDQMSYTWTTDKGKLFFDFHGEPKGAAADVFTSFEKGTKNTAQSDFEAPFEGVHGWYWKNRTTENVTLELKTSGVYKQIARKL